jgi:hypothetical protein
VTTEGTTRHGFGIVGIGAAACVACCAPPAMAFLAAAGLGTLLGVAAFGAIGVAVLVPVVVAHLRRRRRRPCADAVDHAAAVPVAHGRKP